MQFDTHKVKQQLNDRLYTVGEKATAHANDQVEEQISHPDKANPTSNLFHLEGTHPGQFLNQDILYAGAIQGIGEVYLYTLVDTFSGLAFGAVDTIRQSETAVAVLHNDVLPYFTRYRLKVESVLTDRSPEFCGGKEHPYALYLALNDIKHHYIRVKPVQAKGAAEVFHRVVFDEFFANILGTYESIRALQVELDQWLDYYNTVRPNRRYPSLGRSPIDILNYYLDEGDN
jgi:transposase InsO family protein